MLGMLACDLQDLDIITSLVCLCVPTILGACVWNLSRVLKSLEVTCRCQETLAASSGLCAKCQTQVKGRPTPGQVNDRTINTRKAWLCSREQCLSTSANQIDYLEGNTCYCKAMIVNRVEHISIPGKSSSLARVCGS
jgi:hypothetical protein